MVSISWTRRSYEAAVLLVPLDPRARTWLADQEGSELEGIRVAEPGLVRGSQERRHDGDRDVAVSSPLEHAVHASDVVVVLTLDLAGADDVAAVRVADAARADGILLGAVIVSPGARWTDPAAEHAAGVVRDSTDSVVVLADTRFVLPFLQVLRGGTRDDETAGAPR